MPLIDQVNSNYGINGANTLVNSNTLNKEAFLNLLVTQLKYQDPLNPMENTEFVAQLSQFSSLEQLWNVNENLQAESLVSQSIHNSLVASLVGKEVKAVGGRILLPDEGAAKIEYELYGNADVTISIVNESGNLVRTLKMGPQTSGEHEASWDGEDNDGNRVSADEYYLQINPVDSDGNQVGYNSFTTGQITGVRFVEGSPMLLIGDYEIRPADVIEVVLPSAD